MINCRLSTPEHHDLESVNLIPRDNPNDPRKAGFNGSHCTVELEHNQYASEHKGERLAIRVTCAGQVVGYVPELHTIEKWGKEKVEQGKDPSAYRQWYRDVRSFRDQLFTEYDSQGTVRWTAHVLSVRYRNRDNWKTYLELQEVPEEERNSWKVDAVCIWMEV